jgi:hypothetical protein
MTTAEKLTKEQIAAHSYALQEEAIADKTNGVYITHKIKIELIEKVDYTTDATFWTDKEKSEINRLVDGIHNRLQNFIYDELSKNENLGLLELNTGTGDYKLAVKKSKALKELLELVK